MNHLLDDQPGQPLTREQLERVQAETFVEYIEFHERISSTNDRALQLAGEIVGARPLLVIANHQTGGRGRGNNRWWASQGSLTFSLVLDAAAVSLPPRSWPLVSLTVGLAVCEALEELLGNRAARLKWPNDVYLDGRKVCGILVEAPAATPPTLVVGVGINVNNAMQEAPDELNGSAISLREACGQTFTLTSVLTRVLEHISDTLSWIGARDEQLRRRWRDRCLLTGRNIQLEVGPRCIQGICQGIDDDGALLVKTDQGVEHCFGGVVTHF